MSSSQLKLPFDAGRYALAGELAATMRTKREALGWKQRDVAKQIGCAPSTIGALESMHYLLGHGKGYPSIQLVSRVSELYGLPLPRTIEKFRELHRMLGRQSEMRCTGGIGKKYPTRERRIPGLKSLPGGKMYYQPRPALECHDDDENDYAPAIKPGIFRSFKDMVFVFGFIAAVAGLLVLEVWNLGGFEK